MIRIACLAVVLCLVLLVLSACAETGPAPHTNAPGALVVAHDSVRGVTCYRFRHYDGVSCVRTGAP